MSTDVVLLTQEDCDYCDHAKDVLDRLAPDFDVSVSTIDLATSEGQRLAEAGGMLFPPGLFVNGALLSYGRVSERRLRRQLTRLVSACSSEADDASA